MSTAKEIERIPASLSLARIQVGVGLDASIPVAVLRMKLSEVLRPRIGALSEILKPNPSPDTGFTLEVGSLKLLPVACEYSLATPRIDKQYPRSGKTLISAALSASPSSSIASVPTSGSSPMLASRKIPS